MDAGNRHASARIRCRFCVSLGDRPWIVVAGQALAPNRRAFVCLHGSPAGRQASGRDQEVAAAFCLEGLSGGPNIVAERGILNQVAIAFLPHHRGVMADLPVDNRRDHQRAALLAKGHLIIEANLFRERGDLREREALLRRSRFEYLVGPGVLRVQEELDPVQRQRAATKSDLRPIVHVPQTLPGAGNLFRCRTAGHPALDRLQQHLQFCHPPQAGVHIGQFARRAVRDGFALCVRDILRVGPGLGPRLQSQRIMGRVVIFEAEAREERRAPGRMGMFFQKTREAGEVIRAAALGVAEQRGRQGRIFSRARLAADRDERFLEHPRAEELRDRRTCRKLQACFRRLDPRESAVHLHICGRAGFAGCGCTLFSIARAWISPRQDEVDAKPNDQTFGAQLEVAGCAAFRKIEVHGTLRSRLVPRRKRHPLQSFLLGEEAITTVCQRIARRL